jgi:DNA-binding transcriptional regulator GbsR (MarR family)
MTETSGDRIELPHAVQQFVLNWGTLGDRWGVNRSVSLIHALLYASERPLTADEIAATLEIARSNVSTSLRELQTWDIVKAVPARGDRRVFYTAETDLWTLVSRIAAGRKAREIDPATVILRQCLQSAREDENVSPVVVRRLADMLEFVERAGRWYEQMLKLSSAQIAALMKLGSGIVRLLERSRGARGGHRAGAR